jgi:hypothetical protein
MSNLINSTLKRLEKSVKKHGPEILAGIGIGGFITTTVLAIKATPTAMENIEKKKEELDVDKLGVVDTIKATWKPYLPMVITGCGSALSVIGSVSINTRRNAALLTAYQISETMAKEYKDKVIETIGEKKAKKIEESISQDKVDKDPPTTKNIILTDKGNTLFRDSLTGQYFRHDINDLKKKALDMANDELCEGYTGVPEWLLSLGLDIPDTLMGMGWSQLDQGKAVTVDFDAVVARNHGDEPCLVIKYDPMPISDYYTYYK